MDSISISFVDIILGAIGTFAIFNFKEAIKEARRKKLVLTRLNGYLTHWSIKSLSGDNEEDNVSGLAKYGHIWFARYNNCKNVEEIEIIDKEIEESLKKVKEKFIEEELPTKLVEQIKENIKNNFGDNEDYLVEKIENFRSDIIDGKLFPSDTELSLTGNMIAQQSISIKLEIISFLEDIMMFIKFIKSDNTVDNTNKIVIELFLKWVRINKDKMFVLTATKQELSKGTISTAFEIFLNIER
jgi:hypothetical protein